MFSQGCHGNDEIYILYEYQICKGYSFCYILHYPPPFVRFKNSATFLGKFMSINLSMSVGHLIQSLNTIVQKKKS